MLCSCMKHLVTSARQVIGKSLPRPPIEVGLLPHWLAVDGVQPTIPENAPWERPRARKRQRTGAPAAPAAVTAAPAAAPGRQPAGGEEAADGSTLRAPVKHVLSQVGTLLEYTERHRAGVESSYGSFLLRLPFPPFTC